MRKPDVEVREVVCSETGKPMPKIPLWMADIKVKFVSDEARQKHPALAGIPDLEPAPRGIAGGSDLDELKELEAVGAAIEDGEAGFDDIEPDADDAAEEDFDV
jgi:hypothetical protein